MKCKGPNCKSDGKTPHSSECRFEYAANVASGVKGFTMQKENSHLAVLEELKARLNTIEFDVACGNLSAAQTFTKVRDAHAAAIALMRENPGWSCPPDRYLALLPFDSDLVRDAERYRWLKDRSLRKSVMDSAKQNGPFIAVGSLLGGFHVPVQMDAAIDAAILESAK